MGYGRSSSSSCRISSSTSQSCSFSKRTFARMAAKGLRQRRTRSPGPQSGVSRLTPSNSHLVYQFARSSKASMSEDRSQATLCELGLSGASCFLPSAASAVAASHSTASSSAISSNGSHHRQRWPSPVHQKYPMLSHRNAQHRPLGSAAEASPHDAAAHAVAVAAALAPRPPPQAVLRPLPEPVWRMTSGSSAVWPHRRSLL
mmetsp:Transcript_34077/g.72478  ORF Transcript_34077/g.72478 Transcript_34077/m.72478 type:complete len:202 (+) Transcript_34077:379-984(+)